MTLRIYLRFLRPLRSLAAIALYTLIARMWGKAIFRLDAPSSWLVAIGLALPLMLGVAIAGASHEPMHRAFFLVLPNGRRRLRAITIWSSAIAAVGTTLLVMVVVPSVPPIATLGLTAGLVAVPCLNRHRRIAGMDFGAVLTMGWIGACWAFGSRLAEAMETAPWFFFFGGLLAAFACICRSFSRHTLRGRTDIPHIAPQTAACAYLFHPKMMARRQDELAFAQARRTNLAPKGRDWTLAEIGSATTVWMRVFWHAFAGRTKSSYWRTQLTASMILVAFTFLLPLVPMWFRWSSHQAFSLADYWSIIGAIPAPDALSDPLFGAIARMGGLVHGWVAPLSLLLIVHPQLPYPISRARMSRAVFGLSLLQIGAALILPAAAALACSLVGQKISGQIVPGFGLPGVAEINAVLAVFLPLLACAGSFERPASRIGWTLLFAIPLSAVLISRALWAPVLFTTGGIATTLSLCAAGIYLLRWRLHRHFGRSDLVFATNVFAARMV